MLRNLLLVCLAGVLLGLLYEASTRRRGATIWPTASARRRCCPAPPTAESSNGSPAARCRRRRDGRSLARASSASAAATTRRRSACKRRTTTSSTSCRCSTPERSRCRSSRSRSSRSKPRSTRSVRSAPSSGANPPLLDLGVLRRQECGRAAALALLSVRLLIALPAAPPAVHALPLAVLHLRARALGGRGAGTGKIDIHLAFVSPARRWRRRPPSARSRRMARSRCSTRSSPKSTSTSRVQVLRAVGDGGHLQRAHQRLTRGRMATRGTATAPVFQTRAAASDLDPAVNFTTFWSEAVPPSAVVPRQPATRRRPGSAAAEAVVRGVRRRRPRQPLRLQKVRWPYGGGDLSQTEWGSPFCLAMLAILGERLPHPRADLTNSSRTASSAGNSTCINDAALPAA